MAALFILLVPIIAGAQRVLPAADYRLATNDDKVTFTISLTHGSRNLSAVQLDGRLPLIWDAPHYPTYLNIDCYASDGRVTRSIQPSRAVILLPNCRASLNVVVGVFPHTPGE